MSSKRPTDKKNYAANAAKQEGRDGKPAKDQPKPLSKKTMIELALIQEIHAHDKHKRHLEEVTNENIRHRHLIRETRLRLLRHAHVQSQTIEQMRTLLNNKYDKLKELVHETKHANAYLRRLQADMNEERERLTTMHREEVEKVTEETQEFYLQNQEVEQYLRDKPTLLARLTTLKKAIVHEHAALATNMQTVRTKHELEKAALKREMLSKIRETKLWLVRSTEECLHPVARRTIRHNMLQVAELQFQSLATERLKQQNAVMVRKTRRVHQRCAALDTEVNRSACRTHLLSELVNSLKAQCARAEATLAVAAEQRQFEHDRERIGARSLDRVVQHATSRNTQLARLMAEGLSPQAREASAQEERERLAAIEPVDHVRHLLEEQVRAPPPPLPLKTAAQLGLRGKGFLDLVAPGKRSSTASPGAEESAEDSVDALALDRGLQEMKRDSRNGTLKTLTWSDGVEAYSTAGEKGEHAQANDGSTDDVAVAIDPAAGEEVVAALTAGRAELEARVAASDAAVMLAYRALGGAEATEPGSESVSEEASQQSLPRPEDALAGSASDAADGLEEVALALGAVLADEEGAAAERLERVRAQATQAEEDAPYRQPTLLSSSPANQSQQSPGAMRSMSASSARSEVSFSESDSLLHQCRTSEYFSDATLIDTRGGRLHALPTVSERVPVTRTTSNARARWVDARPASQPPAARSATSLVLNSAPPSVAASPALPSPTSTSATCSATTPTQSLPPTSRVVSSQPLFPAISRPRAEADIPTVRKQPLPGPLVLSSPAFVPLAALPPNAPVPVRASPTTGLFVLPRIGRSRTMHAKQNVFPVTVASSTPRTARPPRAVALRAPARSATQDVTPSAEAPNSTVARDFVPLSLRAMQSRMQQLFEQRRVAQSSLLLARQARRDAIKRYRSVTQTLNRQSMIIIECLYVAWRNLLHANILRPYVVEEHDATVTNDEDALSTENIANTLPSDVIHTERTILLGEIPEGAMSVRDAKNAKTVFEPVVPEQEAGTSANNQFLSSLRTNSDSNSSSVDSMMMNNAGMGVSEVLHIGAMSKRERWALMDEWFRLMSNAAIR